MEPNSRPTLRDKKRLALLAFGLFFLFSLLVVQFFRLQIVQGEMWGAKARRQHQMVVREEPRRGVFYATPAPRKGHRDKARPLTIDVSAFHLYIDPASIPEEHKKDVAEGLAGFVSIDEKQFWKKSRSRKLAMWLSPEKQKAILAWWRPFAKERKMARNAVYFVHDYKRSYPYGHLLGQVLQTVREDRDPKTGHAIPTGGLELRFNKLLQGKGGKRLLLRSPRHPLDVGKVLEEPVAGADIHLTIDLYLQAIAEEEVKKAVLQSDAVRGWALMMDPFTGELLACAQYPYFEPEKYRTYYSDPKLLEETRIRSVTDCFEPGSTMKPLTLAIALLANQIAINEGRGALFDPNEKVCTADGSLPGRSKPMKDVCSYRYHNMYTAMQKSANIYLARLIQTVIQDRGAAWYRDALSTIFGFGEKTGVELPSESAGLLPRPGKLYQSGRPEWSAPTPYSLAIGYNIFTNAMQMTAAWAVLANGGYRVHPTLIKKVVRAGETVYAHKGELTERVLPQEVIDQVIPAMKYVTKPGGLAARADVPGYTEVGKTSTAEKIVGGTYSNKNHFSSFIGFAPLSRPRFVIFVGIDEPAFRFIPGIGRTHYGGRSASPAFRNIAKRALRHLGVTPDDPHGYPPPDPRFDPDKADWYRKAKELTDLGLSWHK